MLFCIPAIMKKKNVIYRVIQNRKKIVFHRAVYYSRMTLINVNRDKGSMFLLCIQSIQYYTPRGYCQNVSSFTNDTGFTQSWLRTFYNESVR